MTALKESSQSSHYCWYIKLPLFHPSSFVNSIPSSAIQKSLSLIETTFIQIPSSHLQDHTSKSFQPPPTSHILTHKMHSSTILAVFTAVLAPMAVFAAPEPKHHKHHYPSYPPYPSGTGTGYFPTGTGVSTGVFPTATYGFKKGRRGY